MDNSPVILITGASSGIGAATGRVFALSGYRVVLAARRLERLQALAGELRALGSPALPVETDLTSLEDIQRLVKSALGEFGQIDVLFNNAGMGRLAWLEELDPEQDIETQVQVNLVGMIETTRAVLPAMIARRAGHVINMSSVAGLVATPTYSVYAATKFGVRGFTEALRREVSLYNIHVSGIYPGGTRTEFASHAGIRRKTRKTTPAILRLEPETVARGVLSLVRRPRRSLVLPWPMRLAFWINTAFPGLVDWATLERFTKPERVNK